MDAPAPSSGTDSRGSFIEQDVVKLAVGQVVFGKYLVQGLLGKGGMGEVWLVQDVDLDVNRALKMINKGLAFDSSARARLRLEAQAMAKISHLNFVTLFDLRLDLGNIAYFVMEFIQGDSLEKVLKGHPMPLDWVNEVVTQLCEALHEAHSLRIIHRDLKPSNLILTTTPSGRKVLKVLDFGIAKILGSSGRPNELLTVENSFMGTPPYASPEQACGQAEPLSDIYSVGVIIYEFLTGRRPFKGRANIVIMETISMPPPSFAEVNPEANVPAEIEQVVMRCLAKKPEDRPQSPLALLGEFKAALAKALPVTVPPKIQPEPPPPKPSPPKPPAKNRRAFLIGGTVAAAALGLGLASTLIPREKREPKTPETQLKIQPGPPKAEIPWNGREFYLWPKEGGSAYLPVGYEPGEPPNPRTEGHPGTLVRADGVIFVWIPKGEFQMGALRKENDVPTDWDETNHPPHREVVSGFYLQKMEVTNGELLVYEKVTRKNSADHEKWKEFYDEACFSKSPEIAAKHPARRVSWRIAADFAKRHGGRLPTEAQWEFAARSGGQERALVWSEETDKKIESEPLANLDTQTKDKVLTRPGGEFEQDRTSQGVMDMAGNVREWCRDSWVDYSEMPSVKPTFLPDDPGSEYESKGMVARGGSFNRDLGFRYITRRGPTPTLKDFPADIGFRIVIECPSLEEGR